MEDYTEDKQQRPIEISRIEIIPFRPSKGFVGFASCVLFRSFLLSDIALFTRPTGGLRLGFPIKRLSDGSVLEVFKPLDQDTTKTLEAAITDKYEKILLNQSK
jgi:DNA-binding cell septation regulator SpoVG